MAKTHGPSCHSGCGAWLWFGEVLAWPEKWTPLATAATGEPWKLQVAIDSSYFMQSFWLAPESVPLIGQPFLVPTARFYSIHSFSTLSVLLVFCCCSPRFISMSLASEASSSSAFSSSLSPLRLNPSFLLQFFPSFPFFYLHSLS